MVEVEKISEEAKEKALKEMLGVFGPRKVSKINRKKLIQNSEKSTAFLARKRSINEKDI